MNLFQQNIKPIQGINSLNYSFEDLKSIRVLVDFIQQPLNSTDSIFALFSNLKGAIYRTGENDGERFCYIPGTRIDRVILVAHADTVWSGYRNDYFNHIPIIHNNQIVSTSLAHGIGADDRAGLAIIWLLKELGHSILITDGEEKGLIGVSWLEQKNNDIHQEINTQHQFAIEFDRRNQNEYKKYFVASKYFTKYIENETKYNCAGDYSSTDICILCEKICGVNLSVGYYNEHTSFEFVDLDWWLNSLKVAQQFLNKESYPKFELPVPRIFNLL